MNYDVDSYTISELFAIIEVDEETATTDEIIYVTDDYINEFTQKENSDLVGFFEDVQTRLLQYMEEVEEDGTGEQYTGEDKQTEEWINNQVLPQDDQVQSDKITDRVQKIDVYDNTHVPMKQEHLGVNNNVTLPVAQDTLNPNLTNITTRFINLDSQFRQASGGSETSSTDYTLDLSDHLTDVLSLALYSIQIPYTWYAIDYIYGNTCFWVTNKGNTFKISIEPGNYTPQEFCDTLNTSYTTAGFKYSGTTAPLITTFNVNNGKIKMNLSGWIDPDGNAIISLDPATQTFDALLYAYFTFFDFTGQKNCYETGSYPCSASSGKGQTLNGTLGWLMGYQLPIQPIYINGNVAQSVLNLYGTKYFILVLDDYNQNRINNGLVSITELSNILPIPTYYNTSQPYICLTNVPNVSLDPTTLGNLSNMNEAEAASIGINSNNLLNSLQDKVSFGSGSVKQVLPSAPRTLTQAQLYTVNEIMKNRNKTLSFKSKAPTNSDTFALIPIKYGSMSTGQLYTELSGQFQDNKRIYFGPVDIDRLRVHLLDDRGNTIDLHGGDWSITILAEVLYQY